MTRFLTWNINGAPVSNYFSNRYNRDRLRKVEQGIQRYSPDIACFQEAVYFNLWRFLSNIDGYHASFQRNTRHLYYTSRGGLVTLTKQKPKQTSFTFFDKQGPWSFRGDRFLGKGFLETIVEDEETGEDIRIINTHLLCPYHPKDKPNGHIREQSKQLYEYLQSVEGPLIVAGDFNFRRTSREFIPYKESFEDITAGLPNFPLFKHTQENQIDFIFSSNFYRTEFGYVYGSYQGDYPSDHPGIWADLSLKK